MKSNRRKRGFTLIELLVVVLIVAILAAIAVPQYQKAIDRASFSQAWATAYSIKEAQELYYLTHGSYAPSLNDLDIKMAGVPNQLRIVFSSGGSSTGLFAVYVYPLRVPETFLFWIYDHQNTEHSALAGKKYCFAQKNNKRGNALCAQLANTVPKTLNPDGTCNAGGSCQYSI